MRNARTFARFSLRYEMSGMTRSMPNISSSGNIRPQSMTTMSSPYSNTYMFLPISPTPPRGMMRSGVSLETGFWLVMASREQGELVGLGQMGRRVDERRAAFGRLQGRRGRRGAVARAPGLLEGNRDPRDVLEARRLDRCRPESGRGVVQREDVGARGPGRRVDGSGSPVRPADRRPGPEHVHGV